MSDGQARGPQKESNPRSPIAGSDAKHPIFVRQSPATPAPGTTLTPDPAVIAAQQTAQYTLALTWVTGLLFMGTLFALAVGECQRQAGVRHAERAREKQFERDQALSDAQIADLQQERREEALRRDDEAVRHRVAGIAQLITILQAYERAMNLLLVAAIIRSQPALELWRRCLRML